MGIGVPYLRLDYRRYLFLMLINLLLGMCVAIVSISLMSIGVLFNRKPISGSCGGDRNNCAVCSDQQANN